MSRARPLLAVVLWSWVLLAAGCGVAVQPLEAFNVVIAPTQDCTLTGATSRDCEDIEVLAQQRTRGRWVIEHLASQTFTLTDEVGGTTSGITFNDDGFTEGLSDILPGQPCLGEGGLCYFARRRFESTDNDNNGCTRFGEIVYVLRRQDNGTFAGLTSDTQGTDQDCGTSTIVAKVNTLTLTLAAEPATARDEALP